MNKKSFSRKLTLSYYKIVFAFLVVTISSLLAGINEIRLWDDWQTGFGMFFFLVIIFSIIFIGVLLMGIFILRKLRINVKVINFLFFASIGLMCFLNLKKTSFDFDVEEGRFMRFRNHLGINYHIQSEINFKSFCHGGMLANISDFYYLEMNELEFTSFLEKSKWSDLEKINERYSWIKPFESFMSKNKIILSSNLMFYEKSHDNEVVMLIRDQEKEAVLINYFTI